MTTIQIEPLVPVDIADAVSLVRASFDKSVLPLMIYGQQGIGEYIADLLPRPGAVPSREYLTARDLNGRLIGFAEFDVRNRKIIHLSYICVSALTRGQGVATRLIDDLIGSHPEAEQLQLDVFSSNDAARALYHKLGFIEGDSRYWSTRPIPRSAPCPPLAVADLPITLACLERHGFAMCRIEREEGQLHIGLLGSGVARFQSAANFNDDCLLSSLARVFPGLERALLISDPSERELFCPDTDHVLSSTRMIKHLTTDSVRKD